MLSNWAGTAFKPPGLGSAGVVGEVEGDCWLILRVEAGAPVLLTGAPVLLTGAPVLLTGAPVLLAGEDGELTGSLTGGGGVMF